MTGIEKLYKKLDTKLQEKIDAGIKKQVIANEIGIRHQNFALIERALKASKGLSTETLEALCKYLGV
jgi:DNA-binding Xre family transcriptional regulator